MGLNIFPASSGAAVWGDITGSVSAQTDLTTAFGTQGIKRYCALLTQTGTDAPVATVRENSTGQTLTWNYVGAGSYTVTAGAATFTANKTQVFYGPAKTGGYMVTGYRTSTTEITLQVTFIDESGSNNQLQETAVTILIYP